jgi:hypothetical protein
MLRIFTPEKIRLLRPGLNPRTQVPEASMTARPPKPPVMGLLDLYLYLAFESQMTANTRIVNMQSHRYNISTEELPQGTHQYTTPP